MLTVFPAARGAPLRWSGGSVDICSLRCWSGQYWRAGAREEGVCQARGGVVLCRVSHHARYRSVETITGGIWMGREGYPGPLD